MIPKKIHYCWFGRGPLPQLAKKCIKSWRKYCPDYEIVEWNEDNYDVTAIPFMKEAYEAKKYGFVPDYARYDIIYQYGGIYLDIDVELIKPLDELLSLPGFAGMDNDKRVAFGLGFGAEAGNETIKTIRDRYLQDSFYDDAGNVQMIPAPMKDTGLLKQLGFVPELKKQIVGDIVVFPPSYFDPLLASTRKLTISPQTFSIHWYNASWFDDYQRRRFHHPTMFRFVDGFKMKIKKIIGENAYLRLKHFFKR